MIAVTDTGTGIPQEILDQVFEPFFTTKPPGQARVSALSMVYGLVKQSNGHIKVYSELGRRNDLPHLLPRIRQQETVTARIGLGPTSGREETILVVEDDDRRAGNRSRVAERLGYNVLRARDAASGLGIIESGYR